MKQFNFSANYYYFYFYYFYNEVAFVDGQKK